MSKATLEQIRDAFDKKGWDELGFEEYNDNDSYPSRVLLDRFEPRERSFVANSFKYGHAGDYCHVCSLSDTKKNLIAQIDKAKKWNNASTIKRNQKILDIIEENPIDAESLFWFYMLPKPYREKIARIETKKESTGDLPATYKQMEILRSYGFDGECTRRGASVAIARIFKGELNE
jgi:hypothetical protein